MSATTSSIPQQDDSVEQSPALVCSECHEELQGDELKDRYYGMCRQCATGEEPEL
jgi:hypothetical protein